MGAARRGRLRGCIWLTAGLVVAVLAGAVGYITLQRATALRTGQEEEVGPRVSVVVAAATIDVRAQLASEDLELQEVPVETVPEGAVGSLEEAVGQVTLVELFPGEIVLSHLFKTHLRVCFK